MGLSFHDEASMVEVVGSFLHFTPDDLDPNSIPETDQMESISQERRDESDDGIGGSDDIQMAEMNGEPIVRVTVTVAKLEDSIH